MTGEHQLEEGDYLWALQRACDLAIQAGDGEVADEMALCGESPEDLEKLFRAVQYLTAGLQIRKIEIGMPT